MDIGVIVIIIQLIFLESILSIDNAAVLGAMAAELPDDQPIPWPGWLRSLAPPIDRLLGMQREAALKVGLLGAYLGRTLMLFIATFITENRWLLLLGAAYLVYLAVEHIAKMGEDEENARHGHATKIANAAFWPTVLTIELADLAFSLDNVIAAVALSDQFWVVALGVGIGIVTMRFAAGIFTRLVTWEPALQTGAYLLVLAIGVQLFVREFLHVHIGEVTQFLISLLILVGTIGVARSPVRNFDFLWKPIIALFRILYAPFALMQQLIRRSA